MQQTQHTTHEAEHQHTWSEVVVVIGSFPPIRIVDWDPNLSVAVCAMPPDKFESMKPKAMPQAMAMTNTSAMSTGDSSQQTFKGQEDPLMPCHTTSGGHGVRSENDDLQIWDGTGLGAMAIEGRFGPLPTATWELL